MKNYFYPLRVVDSNDYCTFAEHYKHSEMRVVLDTKSRFITTET
jgi:hypothetical protein